MTSKELENLAISINQGNCILLLGPHLTTENIDGKDISLSQILAGELLDELKELIEMKKYNVHLTNSDNLMQIAQQYHYQKKEGALKNAVSGFYLRKKNIPIPEQLFNLAEIPFHTIISSTQDNLLFRAFEKKKKIPHSDFYNYSNEKSDLVNDGTVNEPLIYHLYGQAEHPSSLVVSENSILEFLVKVIQSEPGLPTNIQSLLTNKNACYLFLGFGLNNWYLRVIIHALFSTIQENVAFAFEKLDSALSTEFKQMVLFYENEYNIHINYDDQNHFVEKLKVKCAELPLPDKKNDISTKSIATQGKFLRIFISYARENKEIAKILFEKLTERGFEPWIDSKKIYGGDKWNDRIEEVLNNEVDYFIFLQSKQMELQFKSYFYKELKIAKDMDEITRPGVNFIIPVKIEECKDVVKLNDRHCIDLTNMDNIDELINAINKDRQLRKRDNL